MNWVPEWGNNLFYQRVQILLDHEETGWDAVDLIDMAQGRDQWRALVNTVLNLRVPGNCWELLEWLHN
jgi:hypothetical protein